MVGKGGGAELQYSAVKNSLGAYSSTTGIMSPNICRVQFQDPGDYFVIATYVSQSGANTPIISNPQILSGYTITDGTLDLFPLFDPTDSKYPPKFFVRATSAGVKLRFSIDPRVLTGSRSASVEITVIRIGSTTNSAVITFD